MISPSETHDDEVVKRSWWCNILEAGKMPQQDLRNFTPSQNPDAEMQPPSANNWVRLWCVAYQDKAETYWAAMYA